MVSEILIRYDGKTQKSRVHNATFKKRRQRQEEVRHKKPQVPTPRSTLPTATQHFPKFPEPHKTAPLAGDQAFMKT
jgi:hypothetical protein